MNYQKIYDKLIQKRKINILFKKQAYCETHHIKPKSIYPQLEKDKNNLVNLTAKEHYLAHHLLVKIYKKKFSEHHRYYLKMLQAFLFTINIQNNKNFVTARVYEKLKIELSNFRKGTHSWNKDKFGVFSQQYRKKISENHADFSGQKNGRFGSRAMIKIETQQKVIVKKEDIQNYLNNRIYIYKRFKKI